MRARFGRGKKLSIERPFLFCVKPPYPEHDYCKQINERSEVTLSTKQNHQSLPKQLKQLAPKTKLQSHQEGAVQSRLGDTGSTVKTIHVPNSCVQQRVQSGVKRRRDEAFVVITTTTDNALVHVPPTLLVQQKILEDPVALKLVPSNDNLNPVRNTSKIITNSSASATRKSRPKRKDHTSSPVTTAKVEAKTVTLPGSTEKKIVQDKVKPKKDLSRSKKSAWSLAFKNDLFRKRILEPLDTPTLNKCRLVCKEWISAAEKELRNREQVTLRLPYYKFGDPKYNKETLEILSFPQIKNSKFASLTSKTKQSKITKAQNPYPLLRLTKKLIMSIPCRTLYFITSQLESLYLQLLLCHVLPNVYTLTLDLRLMQRPSSDTFEESRIFPYLRNVLINQARSVKQFNLKFWVPEHWKGELELWNSDDSRGLFKLEGPVCEFDCHPTNDPVKLPHMEVLSIQGDFPSKACKEILDAAIHLESFICTHNYNPQGRKHVTKSLLSYFNEDSGHNRIQLLREVYFSPTKQTLEEFEYFFLKNPEPRNFYIVTLGLVDFCEVEMHTVPNFWQRVSQVINHLLFISAHSLEKLITCPLRFLPDVRFPQMLNLLTIDLQPFTHMPWDINECYFPRNFSFEIHFPKLKFIDGDAMASFGRCYQFLQQWDIHQPLTSVRRIRLMNCLKSTSKVGPSLQLLFPNAQILMRMKSLK